MKAFGRHACDVAASAYNDRVAVGIYPPKASLLVEKVRPSSANACLRMTKLRQYKKRPASAGGILLDP